MRSARAPSAIDEKFRKQKCAFRLDLRRRQRAPTDYRNAVRPTMIRRLKNMLRSGPDLLRRPDCMMERPERREDGRRKAVGARLQQSRVEAASRRDDCTLMGMRRPRRVIGFLGGRSARVSERAQASWLQRSATFANAAAF